MFKPHDVVDGINIELGMPLGNNFQLQGNWTFSNTKGTSFEITSAINNSSGNPHQSHSEVQSGVFRFESDQTGMAVGNFNLPYDVSCQAQAQFQDPSCEQVMQMVRLEKAFRDNTITLMFQGMNF